MTSSREFPGEFQAGDIVGDTYVVLDYLGRGAMGNVYHVRHKLLMAEYALKTLSSDKVTELAWRRFQNEAQAISILNNPNVVSIYNLGLHRGSLPYYVMDLLVGVDLGEKIREGGPLEIKQAVKIFIEVCAGISYAHKKGIIHRDIKPGNIFLLAKPGAAGETIKVVDFGIAKLSQTKDPNNQALTAIGDVLGTPYYMSPEQCMGQRVDARSDIYSLGCTIFEALTGAPPFRAPSPTATMLLHQSQPPPSLKKASADKEFPDSLEYVVATTLAKEPSDRYQTMDQLAKDLAAVIEGDKPVVVTPGGATIEKVETDPTKRLTVVRSIPRNGRFLIVAPVMAGLFALFGFVFWQSRPQVKKPQQVPLTEQLQKFSPKASDDLTKSYDENYKEFDKRADELGGATTDSAPATRQVATVSLFQKKPFSNIVTEGGKQYRCFDFPNDVVIGRLDCPEPGPAMQATGQLKYPVDQKLIFTPTEIVGRYPDCLKRFQPGDIYGLKFDPSVCTDQIFKATLNLHNIKDLNFDHCRGLTSASLATLKGFRDLTSFDAADSNIDGTMLAQARCWGSLQHMNLRSANHPLTILQELKKAPKLRFLGLTASKLTVQDIQALALLSQLTRLDLDESDITNQQLSLLSTLYDLSELRLRKTHLDASAVNIIKNFKSLIVLDFSGTHMTNDDLAVLSTLPKLRALDLRESGLDASAADILKSFKSLKKLSIRSKTWKRGTIKKLKEALPKVDVR